MTLSNANLTTTKAASAAPVLLDMAVMSGTGGGGVTSQNFQAGFINVGSGPNGTTNRALWIAVAFGGQAGGTSSNVAATWDGVPMQLLGGPYRNGSVGDIYEFGLVNPNLGNKVFGVTWTGNNQICAAGVSVVGADQTGGAITFRAANQNAGTSATSSVTIAGNPGEIVVACHMSPANYSTPGNIDIGFNDVLNTFAVAFNRDSGPATLTYVGGNGAFISAGCAIKAA